MTKHRQALSTAAAALIVGVGAVAVAGCGTDATHSAPPKTTGTPTHTATAASATPQPQTFMLTEHDTNTEYTPRGGTASTTGPTGQPQPGDQLVVTGELLRGTEVVGSLQYTDQFEAGNQVQINGALVLAAGRLTVAGLVPLVEPTVIPIVSGSGEYLGLSGHLVAKGTSADDADLTVELH